MSESNFNVIPAINTVDGFNPADFVRTTAVSYTHLTLPTIA